MQDIIMLATHVYKKNPDSPVGNELDLKEGDTLVYLMNHDDNEHRWLAEDVKGQVGYVPAAYLMIILEETPQEEESDTQVHYVFQIQFKWGCDSGCHRDVAAIVPGARGRHHV